MEQIQNPFEALNKKLGDIESELKILSKNVKPIPVKPAEQYLTANEVKDMLSISLVTLWHWDKKGITNPVKIGNLKRYKLSDIDRLLNSNTEN